ncbi:exopolysaccharide biosynthesis polyprenyl glycosylphosphotransferase [Streptomyces griseochromogenes]|uniref:Transferase n=1 Tax=Streptomyces griseochromogenes TaxID=68214 RepID=A0A1B1B8P5_9ACTN|nr:exopolysaccharide biosynthesis polyprenyl glycosylphosphotransferase [Streptomyces griseochromogenes]ANP55163.1 transferase [Streptomyces griseochromogenes]MBP2050401.1 exopolysaccharide biosynthesis polyprenyl glycosylphosphotransferase [Streptomyces griseochromogenes]
MTAERTVPSPAGEPGATGRAVSVLTPPGSAAGRQIPSGRGSRRPRQSSWTPLLIVDCGGTLAGALVVPGAHRYPLFIAFLALCVIGLNRRALLYDTSVVPGVLDELPAVCGRVTVGWALVAAFSPLRSLPRTVLVTACAVHCLVACVGRGAVYLRRRRALRHRPRPALVVGSVPVAMRVADALQRCPGCEVRPVGIVADAPGSVPDSGDRPALPVLSTGEEARRACVQNGVETVLVVEPATRVRKASLLRDLAESGCALWELDAEPSSYGPRGPRARAGHLAGFSRRLLSPGTGPRRESVVKRLLDVALSGSLLLLVSPVLLVCAAVLRAAEGPDVVFRQERISKDGRPFTMLKFRTHRPSSAHEAATRWSVADEREMSRFCRFLRRTSLDELLQLWNVFRGDMSLVGPRPERPYFVNKFSQVHSGYPARHRMRTGMTGLAQIHGLRGDTSIEDRCRFDNAYIDNWSLWQDICILVRTAVLFVRPTGS